MMQVSELRVKEESFAADEIYHKDVVEPPSTTELLPAELNL
jgi:hypothetical protein